MGTTVIGTVPGGIPIVYTRPRISIKQRWSDSWEERFDLQIVSFSNHTFESGVSTCEFFSRYNDKLKLPTETDFTNHPPLDLSDYWVRVELGEGSDTDIAFQGKIYNDARIINGSADRMIGVQPWVAFGPKKIISDIDVSRSFWLDGGDEKECAWLPEMNTRDKRKLLVGNRSDDAGGNGSGAYLYGGKSVWTHLQFMEYIVERFVVQDQAGDAPQWTITGQTDALDGLQTSINWGNVANVADICKKLASRDFGLDISFNYLDEGFEIQINSLLTDNAVFEDAIMPANPNRVQQIRGNQLDMADVKIIRSNDNLCDQIRILGKRAIMCASFGGLQSQIYNDLAQGWTPTLEAEYIAGTGTPADDPSEHDRARKRDKFAEVYQLLTLPEDFDYRNGSLNPQIGLDGTIQTDGGSAIQGAPFQNSVRKTEHWIPLKKGFVYTTDPPTDSTDTDREPEMMAPLAYIWNEGHDEHGDDLKNAQIECHLHGMHVSVPHNSLGILINATPNHLLALNHAFADGSSEADSTDEPDSGPLFDYETVICTIAWETDQRLQYGFDVPDDLKKRDGSRHDIMCEDAEMWLLAPNTIVGLDATGTFQYSGDTMRILRDDTKRLKQLAAGAFARYTQTRIRAEVTWKTLLPWSDFVGQILEVVEEVDTGNPVGSPITSMTWTCGKNPSLKMLAGYA